MNSCTSMKCKNSYLKQNGYGRQMHSKMLNLTSCGHNLKLQRKKAPSGSAASGNIASIKKTLLETVDLFDERKKSSTFNDDIYEFDRNGFDKWIARFRDDINKL